MLPTCSPTWLYQFILLSIVFGNFCFFSSFPSGFKKLYQSDKYEMVLLCISLNTNEVEYLLMFVVHLCFLFFFTDESFIRTRQDVSTPFPFIQKVEHFKYINFSLQQNFFQSGPRNCLSLQDSRFSNTYAPITAKRAYLNFG